jgi:hypothetical protein
MQVSLSVDRAQYTKAAFADLESRAHPGCVGMSVLAMISDGYLDLYGLWSMPRA